MESSAVVKELASWWLNSGDVPCVRERKWKKPEDLLLFQIDSVAFFVSFRLKWYDQ